MKSMPSDQTYRPVSFWLDTVPGSLAPREVLPGDLAVDVAIAGAGLTGLWTAYYLPPRRPALRVAVCEAEIAGFGASGRNGGWCSALFPASLDKLARMAGRDAAVAHVPRYAGQRSTRSAGSPAAEHIDCHWAKGGTVQLARSAVQLERAKAEVAEMRGYGFGEEDLRTARPRPRPAGAWAATGVLGGTYTPHCAAIHPARLVRGLAQVVRDRGAKLFERTPVTEIAPGKLVTTRGDGHGRPRHPGHRGVHPGPAGPAPRGRTGVLADDRDRAAARRGVGLDRAGRAADLQRRPAPASSTASAPRTGGSSSAAGARRTTWARPSGRRSTGHLRCSRRCAGRWASCFPPSGTLPSRTRGAGRWASPGTGAPRRASTAPPGSAGPAGTSATGWPPPTWPDAPWPT